MSARHISVRAPRWFMVCTTALLCARLLPGTAHAQVSPRNLAVEVSLRTRVLTGKTGSEAPVDQVTLTHRVSYADLDLTTLSDQSELRRRVAETARFACEQLERLYPRQSESVARCTRQAVEDTSAEIDAAIEAAEREARGE
ncbi:MAG: UrcA family protein [Pseudomonadota bacterium]|nr:UrcA family protein [Pseudomonadota bacterium]